MNNSTYIFGKFGKGYTQYPFDSNSSLFQKCVALSVGKDQLVVIRRGDLMFYTFVRFLKADSSEYIGISLSFSSLMMTDVEPLFRIFEDGIMSLAVEGKILTYIDNDIVHSATSLETMASEVRTLDGFLSSKLSRLGDYMTALPPQNYDAGAQSVKRCHLNVNPQTILQYTQTYDYVVISSHVEGEYEPTNLQKILSHSSVGMSKGSFLLHKIKQIFR